MYIKGQPVATLRTMSTRSSAVRGVAVGKACPGVDIVDRICKCAMMRTCNAGQPRAADVGCSGTQSLLVGLFKTPISHSTGLDVGLQQPHDRA